MADISPSGHPNVIDAAESVFNHSDSVLQENVLTLVIEGNKFRVQRFRGITRYNDKSTSRIPVSIGLHQLIHCFF